VTDVGFQPDGLILATGHDTGAINLWDIRTLEVFQTISNEDVSQPIHQIAFSNKGYLIAASWKNSSLIKLYDMRKGFGETAITFDCSSDISLSFDPFGAYLMASDKDKCKAFTGKQWTQPQFNCKLDDTGGSSLVTFSKKSLTAFQYSSEHGKIIEYSI